MTRASASPSSPASGRPYSLTLTGGSIFNDSASGTNNALVYVPTGISDPNLAPTSNAAAVQQLVDFVNATPARGAMRARRSRATPARTTGITTST